MSEVGYRVDVISEDGELLARSPIITKPPWSRVDDAVQEAESIIGLLGNRGIVADVCIGIVLTGVSPSEAAA